MWRVVLLCWVFLAPTLAGVLDPRDVPDPGARTPSSAARILYAALAGAVMAIPALVRIRQDPGARIALSRRLATKTEVASDPGRRGLSGLAAAKT